MSKGRGTRFKLANLVVSGTQYHALDVVPKITEADDLLLVPEPQNIYDQDAVRVDWEDHCIGYVPREHAQMISALLTHGFRMEATVDYAGQGVVAMDIWMFR